MTDFAKEKASSRQRVLDMLWDKEWHEWHEIHRVGGVRYSARLLELKRLGYDIETKGSKVEGLSYRLRSFTKGAPQEKRVKVFLHEADARKILARGNVSMDARNAFEVAINSFERNRNKL